MKTSTTVGVVVALIIAGGAWYWMLGGSSALIEKPLSQVYANTAEGFSLRLPSGYVTDEKYIYQELGPSKDISGIRFTIPAAVAAGTNLSTDSYISIEKIPNVRECTASLFLEQGTVQTITEGDTAYSVASSTGAAAGNRYEETVYALKGTNPCIAVRYLIHYGVFENYPAGTVREFDKRALLAAFDAIRRSLTITH